MQAPPARATQAPESLTDSIGRAGGRNEEAGKFPLMPGTGVKQTFALLLLCLVSAWSQNPSELPYVGLCHQVVGQSTSMKHDS